MKPTNKPKATILVDVQNIYYTTRQIHRCHFDYNAFWAEMEKQYQIVTAIAYAIDRGDEKQRQFQNILRAIGFEVRLKPYIQRSDGSSKGDWDVGITLDAMEHAPQSDHLVLLSGDGDFDLLVEKIKSQGVIVDVYGVERLTATSLINAASRFVAIGGSLLLK